MKAQKFMINLLIIGMAYFGVGCSDRKTDASLAQLPVKVQAQKAQSMSASEVFAYSGTIEESESIPLGFSVIGRVSRVLVPEGDYLKKGQLLAELSGESYKNSNDMAQALLKQAEDAYNRLQPMYKNGNLPEIKFVEIQTSLQQAKSAAAIAQKSVDDCFLYAPASGYVGKRSIEPGQNVIPGLSAINIVKIDKLFARISVSENEIASIKKGQEAVIKVGALGDGEFKGTVEEIGVMADPIAHTYKVRIGIPNEDKVIKPGMICSVTIQTEAGTRGITIPNQALQVDEKGNTFVFSVDESQNRALRKYVKTGRLLRNGVEIKEGLNEGEWVVVAGQQKLVDQSLVEMINR